MERGINMELVFLYVNLSRSKFIEKSGFNFSPNYNFEVNYKDGWYELSENKQKKTIADDFFDKDTFNKLGYKAKINTHTTSYIN